MPADRETPTNDEGVAAPENDASDTSVAAEAKTSGSAVDAPEPRHSTVRPASPLPDAADGASPKGPTDGYATVPPAPRRAPGKADLLVAARPSPFLRAVVQKLERLGHSVVAASPRSALARFGAVEPRLVVMDLEACASQQLVAEVHRRQVPIAVFGSGVRTRTAMAARSLGARHVVEPAFSVEATTQELARCLDVETKHQSTLAEPQPTSLGELLATLEHEIRRGLARSGVVSRYGDVRFVLKDPQLMATYVRRLRAALARSTTQVEPAVCGLTDDRIPVQADLALLPMPLPLDGARVVLVDADVSRVDAAATALRATGAHVFVCSAEQLLGELSRIASLDPTVILVEDVLAPVTERLVAEVASGCRLRFTKVVSTPLAQWWQDRAIDVDSLVDLVLPIHLEEEQIAESFRKSSLDGVDLATLGPARLLFALARAGLPCRLSHLEASFLSRVELARDGVVSGASARLPNRDRLEGPAALAAFLARVQGKVQLERLVEPTLVNILAPVSAAIGLASEESLPVVTSSLPPGPVTQVTWSNMPGPMAGRATWTSIPALSPEALSAYAIKDPGELLDAVEDDEDDDDLPTRVVDPDLLAALKPPGLPNLKRSPARSNAPAAPPGGSTPPDGPTGVPAGRASNPAASAPGESPAQRAVLYPSGPPRASAPTRASRSSLLASGSPMSYWLVYLVVAIACVAAGLVLGLALKQLSG